MGHKTHITKHRGGFSVIEIVIVIAVSALIFSFTLGIGYDFYSSQTLIAERDTAVNLLRRARMKALNNVNQSDHGISISSASQVVFEGPSYAMRNPDFDETFPRSPGVDISGPAEILFFGLEGNSNASGTISISNARGKADISINYEGRINW